jgi:hypothetical protein
MMVNHAVARKAAITFLCSNFVSEISMILKRVQHLNYLLFTPCPPMSVLAVMFAVQV